MHWDDKPSDWLMEHILLQMVHNSNTWLAYSKQGMDSSKEAQHQSHHKVMEDRSLSRAVEHRTSLQIMKKHAPGHDMAKDK